MWTALQPATSVCLGPRPALYVSEVAVCILQGLYIWTRRGCVWSTEASSTSGLWLYKHQSKHTDYQCELTESISHSCPCILLHIVGVVIINTATVQSVGVCRQSSQKERHFYKSCCRFLKLM